MQNYRENEIIDHLAGHSSLNFVKPTNGFGDLTIAKT